jgi:hypothetical protein
VTAATQLRVVVSMQNWITAKGNLPRVIVFQKSEAMHMPHIFSHSGVLFGNSAIIVLKCAR